ncbi:hypothetical protein ACQPYK_49025 (plasmid) [Streptosporangium sp. CA-135522]|uniref:hypothetical protein n=1 Tax=Streptosporangium sp. CA-135522 TaxID=3240072 RepID=UPI003D94CFBD
MLRELGLDAHTRIRIAIDANRVKPTASSYDWDKVAYVEDLGDELWAVRLGPGGPIYNPVDQAWTFLDDERGEAAFYFHKRAERAKHGMTLSAAIDLACFLVDLKPERRKKTERKGNRKLCPAPASVAPEAGAVDAGTPAAVVGDDDAGGHAAT